MQLLGKRHGGVIVGHLSRSGTDGRCERNAVVNVEDTGVAARGPDGGGGLDGVLLGVDLTKGESLVSNGGHAGHLL